MSEVDPERLARWRTWATRFDPNRPDWREERDRHVYTSNCTWCRADHYPTDPLGSEYCRDGNAHDAALMLLDRIVQLEAELHVFKLSAGIGQP